MPVWRPIESMVTMPLKSCMAQQLRYRRYFIGLLRCPELPLRDALITGKGSPK